VIHPDWLSVASDGIGLVRPVGAVSCNKRWCRERKASMQEAVEERPGRGRPRSERARAAILAAAAELLVSGGIDAVTMEAIAARARVSKSTIYKWWPSRAHVILESFFNRARHTMAVDENASLQEVLTAQVTSLARLFRDSDAGPLMADLMAASQADPDIRAALDEQWLRPRRQIGASLLRAGMERGELDAGIDIAAAVDQIFAPVYYRLLLGHEPLHDALAATLVRQVLDGLRTRPQPGEGPGAPLPAAGHSAGT
jgi:AcrR family transcriptional regulator